MRRSWRWLVQSISWWPGGSIGGHGRLLLHRRGGGLLSMLLKELEQTRSAPTNRGALLGGGLRLRRNSSGLQRYVKSLHNLNGKGLIMAA